MIPKFSFDFKGLYLKFTFHLSNFPLSVLMLFTVLHEYVCVMTAYDFVIK